MKARNLFSKILAGVLAVVMLLGMVPVFASAAETTSDLENLVTTKTATLNDNGTYDIELSAYAKGELTVSQEKMPLDIILVLDQSGSMAYSFTYNEVTSEVKYEVFDGSYYESYSTEIFHVCADNTYQLLNVTREYDSTGYRYRYSCQSGENGGIATGCPFSSHSNHCLGSGYLQGPNSFLGGADWGDLLYIKVETTTSTETTRVEALKSTLATFVASVESDAKANNLDHKIAIVGFGSEDSNGYNSEILTVAGNNTQISNTETIGVKYSSLTATEYANALVSYDAAIVDQAIAALATSGATRTDLGMKMAKGIIDAAGATTDRKRVVIMFTDGVPTSSNEFNTTVAGDTIEYAYSMKQGNVDVYTVGIFDDANAATLIANISGTSETDNANRFMHATSSNYPNATTWGSYGDPIASPEYYKAAADSAELNEVFGAISESITSGTDIKLNAESVLKDVIASEFKLPDGFSASDVIVQTAAWDGTGFGTPVAAEGVNVTVDGNTVSVSGFDYSTNYCVDGKEGGNKLIVTIPGVEATDAAITGTAVNTNTDASGIYENASSAAPVEKFPMPQTVLTSYSYVLDYAKPVTLNPADWLQTSVKNIAANMKGGFADAPVFNYGTYVNSVYTPNTTKWDGFDTFYAFGKTSDATVLAASANDVNDNLWSKINVIPANNVYYEDTFISNTTTGTVGITYGGEWTEVTSGETAGSNTETANGAIQGWVTDLANDAADSDGTIHMSSDKGATATFSFTGTGFDVYSRTNMTSGKVYAKISWTDADGNARNKGMIVDTESASGEYYNIPTLWFSGDYAEYTVTIKVQTDAEGTYSYCIDGIRIYNPLGDEPTNEDQAVSDDVVQDAYEEEIEAAFMSVRDLLIDSGNFNATGDTSISGYVFIDKLTEEQVESTEPSEPEETTEPSETTATESEETTASTVPDKAGTPTVTNQIGTYKDYGPKNEVYLAPGQGIVFPATDKVHVGLKAPQGSATAVVSYVNGDNGAVQGEIAVNHTTDLYYEAVASNGFVVIKNKEGSTGLLSVTKVKFFPTDAVDGYSMRSFTLNEAVAAADNFDAMPVMAYSMRPTTPEEPTEPEVPTETPTEPENPTETPTEPETPTEIPTEPEVPTEPENKPNIDIQNPTEPEEEKPNGPTPEQVEELKVFMNKLFNAFRGWLKR